MVVPAVVGEGDDVVSCPKCRVPPPFPGSYVHRNGRYEVPPSYFLIRGDVESRGPQMQPGFLTVATTGNPPTAIPRPDGNTSGRRLALARWIASADNPLTARVIVNRLWQKHFGRGIVATLENFGRMGEPPTHQALLDWLAVEFVEGGWSVKRINKLMMMSEAYQMASAFEDAANAAADAENRYVWRFRPQRLEAEIVRDALLVAGGNLDDSREAERGVGLPIQVVAPAHHGAVVLDGEDVPATVADGCGARKVWGWVCLAVVVVAPADDGLGREQGGEQRRSNKR